MDILSTVSLPPSWLSLFSYHICIAMSMNHTADSSIPPMKIVRQANPDDDCLNSASGPQVAASSSGSGKNDDEEDDPWKRNNP